MKKTWNSPEVQELTIQATAWWGGGHGYGDHGHGGSHGGGRGDSNLCKCQGGTSPCEFHHFGDEEEES